MNDIVEPTNEDVNPTVPVGDGDHLDLAAGRCCPTCRHDLTPHNVAVWNAGYSVAVRHLESEIREAWDAGFSAHYSEFVMQGINSDYAIRRDPAPFMARWRAKWRLS